MAKPKLKWRRLPLTGYQTTNEKYRVVRMRGGWMPKIACDHGYQSGELWHPMFKAPFKTCGEAKLWCEE